LPHFLDGNIDQERQPLATVLRITGQAGPATLDVLAVSVGKFGRDPNLAILDPRACRVTDPVGWSNDFAGQLGGFL